MAVAYIDSHRPVLDTRQWDIRPSPSPDRAFTISHRDIYVLRFYVDVCGLRIGLPVDSNPQQSEIREPNFSLQPDRYVSYA